MGKRVAIVLCLLLSANVTTYGASETYLLNMTGILEKPSSGDPDGLGIGSIFLDDVSGQIVWDILYSNIDPPTAMHIHTGALGVPGPVKIGLGVVTTGGPGTLKNSLVWPSSQLADITGILNDPAQYYINIHNSLFPAGAVRDQLGVLVPEPGTWALIVTAALSLLAVAWRKRRTS